ncbi:hypothetical protein Calag_0978 [Caldisphaera lagunensis DSM 15908]|uniref:Uncharacterized protein n=1 Tax=Caldisphaera lagunensis (strain DSM 15908 / JCM 11604 / ANMR 0165 / IC-154) TaxID=1056495 RepID=L0AA18_CALLD|nr:hypothetical protein [Caldisphaera lagunensis]AFZ70701.1 hypothetical protein Calag_0978 [Caldisphaera lagunensis DSM 15908]
MPAKFFINEKNIKFNESQAFNEELIGNLFKEPGSTYLFLTHLKDDGNSIGLYYKYEGRENTYRRITGGPKIDFYENYVYLSILTNRVETLKKVNERAKLFSKCISGTEIYGGLSISRDKKLAYGITKIGNISVIEIITNNNLNDIKYCLKSNINNVNEEMINVIPNKYSSDSYLKKSWISYGNKDYEFNSSSRNEGFYVNFSAKLLENYIDKVLITGNFYASPPMEPITSILALEGTPVNEVYFYGIKARIKKIEIEGIKTENILFSIDDLYNKLIKSIK